MTFQDDNGNILEVQGDFAMTKQAVSFFNFSINGDVSVNFNVDNNSENRRVLNYDGPQMLNQVAFTKQAFNRIRNGNKIDRGYIVIQSDEGDTLNCFYTSGNSNWIQELNSLLTSINWPASISAKTGNPLYRKVYSNSSINANEDSGIIFPLVDWNYEMNKGSLRHYFLQRASSGRPTDQRGDTSKYTIIDFYPCLYAHSLFNEIGNSNSVKFKGSLFSDPLFRSIVVTPKNGQMKRSFFPIVVLFGSTQTVPASSTVSYTNLTVVNDVNSVFINNTYTAREFSSFVVTIKVNSATAPANGFLRLRKNGTTTVFLVTLSTGTAGQTFTSDIILTNPGDTFTFTIQNNSGGSSNTYSVNATFKTSEIVGIDDNITPSCFLPELKCIDFIKSLFIYLGCSVYFDDYTKTINANIIENFKVEDSEEWSGYYLSHRSEYTVEQAQNNYVRLTNNTLDGDVERYNQSNDIGFGEGNIETRNTLKKDNNIASLPFKGIATNNTTNGYVLPSVPLVNLVDSGEPIAYSSAASATFGRSELTLTSIPGTDFNLGEIVRVSSSDGDRGYFRIVQITATTIFIDEAFISTSSGNIYRQNINYNDIGFCLLSAKVNAQPSEFSDQSNLSIETTAGGYVNFPNIHYATFTKPVTGLPIDLWKGNLAFDNPTNLSYKDPTIKQLYFNKISKFLQNPNIRAKMILPESVFQSFKFDRFIYLKTEKLSGYFFVKSIANYVDSNTPVEINLYML